MLIGQRSFIRLSHGALNFTVECFHGTFLILRRPLSCPIVVVRLIHSLSYGIIVRPSSCRCVPIDGICPHEFYIIFIQSGFLRLQIRSAGGVIGLPYRIQDDFLFLRVIMVRDFSP